MKDAMPQAYDELVENCEILEKHYQDMMVIFSLSYVIKHNMRSQHQQLVDNMSTVPIVAAKASQKYSF